ncbi:hypothetical protein RJ640_025906 [Escallonia rubra]|uniref:Smr domain-containing protein n=1 Tax=Escallonia rubra TaxID=112253 RepID=A0AA88UGS9_9ASTE|nr:hypothetical protein RJ640_025906 [Escallonia rubra]
MKHTKKRKKRQAKPAKQVAGHNGTATEDATKKATVLESLMEAFVSVSLDEADSAYREANGDPNKAAEILGGLTEVSTGCSSSGGGSESASSSSGRSSEGFGQTNFGGNVGGCEKVKMKKKVVVASTGMVGAVLGKDYVRTTPKTERVKGCVDMDAEREDMEQFLCGMLGDECELSMAVVRDCLSPLILLLSMSPRLHEERVDLEHNVSADMTLKRDLSKNGQCRDSTISNEEDMQFLLEASDSIGHLTQLLIHLKTSFRIMCGPLAIAENVEERLCTFTLARARSAGAWETCYLLGEKGQLVIIPNCFRTYFEALAGPEAQTPTSPKKSESELPWTVLETLFNVPKSSEREPDSMNWRNVVKKMESLGPRFESCPSGSAEPRQRTGYAEPRQPTPGSDYQEFRKSATQHWDSMKSCYQKAATAYRNGAREYASHLSDQGRLHNKMAREADEKASQDIFEARNKSFENVITIDLHGQHVKQAMRLLKLHLIFGAYVRSVQLFRVITGCGSRGVGKSKLKQSVIDLIQKEGIEWGEENRGTLLIRLGGQTEFSFLDCASDTE